MKKKLVFFLAVLYLLVNILIPASAEIDSNLNIHAHSAILFESSSGRILWGKNTYEKRAMASTTKIMTCIVALENGNLTDKVRVSKKAASAPRVKLYIKPDEEYVLEDLLYALMLQSSNDVAVAISEYIAGTEENFCNMMTAKAKEIGALNTCYKTANGLDAEGHYSTAYDLALIASYALKNKEFMKIINTKNWSILKSRGNSRNIQLTNKNTFLTSYNGSNGVKTGFTGNAGYCFVGAANRNEMQLISVVLGSGWPPNKTWKWQDTKKIMDYGFENYKITELMPKNKKYRRINVKKGKKDSVYTYIEGSFDFPMCLQDKFNVKYNVPEILEAPILNNQKIGDVCLYVNDKLCKRLPIKTIGEVERVDFYYFFEKLINRWILGIAK